MVTSMSLKKAVLQLTQKLYPYDNDMQPVINLPEELRLSIKKNSR